MAAESIDLMRIQEALEAERRTRPTYGPVQSAVRSAMRAAVMLSVIVFLLPVLVNWDLSRLTALNPRSFALRVAVVLFGAMVMSLFDVRASRRAAAEDPTSAAQKLAAEWRSLILPDWWTRVLRQGVVITAGVGIPVGLFVAVKSPTTELPSGGRLELFVMFLLLTAVWAVPAAFAIRWMVLRSYRRMVERTSGRDSVSSA